jgi:hypothetical protein
MNETKRRRGRPPKFSAEMEAQIVAAKKFVDAWVDYKESEEGKDKLKYIQGKPPYNVNVMWWIFQAGYNAAIK